MIIDNPYVIDRETVKSLLQISDTSQDALIDLYLPIVSDDINIITNYDWVKEYTGTLANTSTTITDITLTDISKGWLVSTQDYTQAIVTDADLDNNTLTVDTAAITDTEGATIKINEFPVGKRIVVAQMVGFQIAKNIGTASTTKGSVVTKSLPPLSVTYDNNDSSIAKYGYPSYMINSLKSISRVRFT